jgi:hypothetical protein
MLGRPGRLGGSPINLGAAVLVPDQAVFPNPLATIDMRPDTGSYFGGPQSLANVFSTGQGNLMRSYIAGVNPSYSEQSDGSIKTFTTTQALRPVTGGIRINLDHTNIVVSPRDFTNAAWVKDAGVTAAKNQTGRTNVANSASSLTWTVDDATVTQTIVLAASVRAQYCDAKRLTGAAPLEWSKDGTNWFTVPLDKPRFLGIGRYKLYNGLTDTNPSIRFRSKAGNSFLLDFVNNDNTGGVEADVCGANARAWGDRLSAQSVDNSPLFALTMQNEFAMFVEWWQRRDDPLAGLFRSDGHMNLTSCTSTGITWGGASFGVPRIAPDDGVFLAQYRNRLCFWRQADGKVFGSLNGADPVQSGTVAINGAATHWDILTNGAQIATAWGAFSRLWGGTTLPTTAYAKGISA